MLKLKKIHILGFKSFCDRTEVTVAGTGIAVVVGPNGCGKSNILDAVSSVSYTHLAFGFATDILVRIGSAMCLAEGVSTGDEGNCLFVIHRHARERLPNIPRRGDWIRLAIGSFRIHIDQALSLIHI